MEVVSHILIYLI